jgi:predicted TIM-barrel fold metal-dependent hydrolase
VSCDLLFERFPNVRVASVENGSGFLPELLRNLANAKERNPWHFKRDPEVLFREHVYMSPFWEDDLEEVIGLMGSERVIFGSDWPHMEGLPDPRDILEEQAGLSDEVSRRFLHDTTLELTKRRVY